LAYAARQAYTPKSKSLLLLFFRKEDFFLMRALVLGSAAGGGFPQWNCGCPHCTLARSGDPRAQPRTQAGIALSTGTGWLLIGASPDLRAQILASPALAPPPGTRHSPIAGVVLVSADVDGMAGLLVLREQHGFKLYAPQPILDVLAANSVFASLDPALVARIPVAVGEAVETPLGMTLTLLAMPGKIPLYQEDRAAAEAPSAITYAARVAADGRVCVVAPACARITDDVLASLGDADTIFFDGTLFRDDEMITAGLSWKTGRRMGHVSVSGQDGALAGLAGLRARKIFFHINNSNPMLLADSAERRAVMEARFEVAFDGMAVDI
jgi:pyrroloquinoline quinone biosynthesis protein B